MESDFETAKRQSSAAEEGLNTDENYKFPEVTDTARERTEADEE